MSAPDVAAADLDRWLYETFTRHGTAARWARLDADDRAYWTRKAAEVRALLGVGQAREMCPVHQVPGADGAPIATPILDCLDCGRWAS